MLSQIRAFLTVIEEGSLHRAATRLNLSQSALSRQMQALEHEVGGKLLDRSSSGVRPTNGGHALAAKMSAFVASYDAAILEVRRIVRGESAQLRIGYMDSASRDYLNPALEKLRHMHPETKVKLLALSPGEQITALRCGEIDLALTEGSTNLLGQAFHTRNFAVIKSIVSLPSRHPLAARKKVRLAELKNETFVTPTDDRVPGCRRRITELCRRYGKFRPKLIESTENLAGALALVANDDGVALLPAFMRHRTAPGIVMIPVADAEATWNLFVAWHRGEMGAPLRTLLGALPLSNRNSEV